MKNNSKHFLVANLLALFTAVIIVVIAFIIGRDPLFLKLNTDFGKVLDLFFIGMTCVGDGLSWLPLGILLYFVTAKTERKKTLFSAVCTFVIMGVIVTILKHLIKENRPLDALTNPTIHTALLNFTSGGGYSFPSGHTSSIVTMYLFVVYQFRKYWIVLIGFVICLLVGYSRIYLAQHFPTDVAAGMAIGVVSMQIVIFLHKILHTKNCK